MRSKISRRKQLKAVRMQGLVSNQAATYRALFSHCNTYLKLLLKPCLRLAGRRRSARARSTAIALLVSLIQTLELRVKAVREHLRTLRAIYEQSLFWLHSADPYTT